MSEHRADELQVKRPFLPRMVRVLAIPIIIAWALLAITTNTFVPKVEDVATELAGPEIPTYAPSQFALLHIGDKFQESNSTSLTMVVLEADHPLDDQDHQYYDGLVQRLKQDTKHVQYAMDLWGKPITAAGAQSIDGKATYVLLRLAGNVGQIQANESVAAVRDTIANDTPPQGLKVYVSGSAPMASDTLSIANNSLNNITIVTIVLILVMLLLVYRSLTNVAVPMYSVLFEILIAKGVVSTLGHYGFIPMSSFAVNIVVSLTLGAGTDYGIFLLGRYHEARQLGESREEAYYTAYRGVAPIIIGSGLTIAGSCFCLSFARLDYFHTMGPAVAISHAVDDLGGADARRPRILTVGSLFGLFDPKKHDAEGTYTGGLRPASCDGQCRSSSASCRRRACSGRSSCRPTQVSYDDRASINRPTGTCQPRLRGVGSTLSAQQAVQRDADGRVATTTCATLRTSSRWTEWRGRSFAFPASPWCRASPDHLGRPLDRANAALSVHHVKACGPPVNSCRSIRTPERPTPIKQAQDPGGHRRDARQDDRPDPDSWPTISTRRSSHSRICRRSPTK